MSSELKLERLVQIGIVVADLDQTTRLLTSLFGIGPFRSVEWPDRPESKYEYRGVEEHIRISQAFVQLGDVEIELIQPLEGDAMRIRSSSIKRAAAFTMFFSR